MAAKATGHRKFASCSRSDGNKPVSTARDDGIDRLPVSVRVGGKGQPTTQAIFSRSPFEPSLIAAINALAGRDVVQLDGLSDAFTIVAVPSPVLRNEAAIVFGFQALPIPRPPLESSNVAATVDDEHVSVRTLYHCNLPPIRFRQDVKIFASARSSAEPLGSGCAFITLS